MASVRGGMVLVGWSNGQVPGLRGLRTLLMRNWRDAPIFPLLLVASCQSPSQPVVVGIADTRLAAAVFDTVGQSVAPARDVTPMNDEPLPSVELPIATTVIGTVALPALDSWDLFGDGSAAQFVEIPQSCGSGGCSYCVYVGSPPGRRLVARVDAHDFDVERRSHRPADIVSTWFLGQDSLILRQRFANGRYRPFRERDCHYWVGVGGTTCGRERPVTKRRLRSEDRYFRECPKS